MSHLEEELSAYVSNELRDEERRTVEEHLASCKDCMDQLQKLQNLDSLLSQSQELDPGDMFFEKVMHRVDQERKVLMFRSPRTVLIFVTAAIILFVAFLLTFQKETPAPPPVVEKLPVPRETASTQQSPKQKPVQSDKPVAVEQEDPELIAHLEDLQNLELIYNLNTLDHLDLAIVIAGTEGQK